MSIEAEQRHLSLPLALVKRFGPNFVDQYFHAKSLRYDEEKGRKQPELPYFEEADKVLKNSRNFRFIIWNKGPNRPDWMYLTTEKERRPDGEGDEYTCYKGYKYDQKSKKWRQIFTHIGSYEELTLRDSINDAVYDSENEAIIDSLGMPMFEGFLGAQYINPDHLDRYPDGDRLKKLVARKKVRTGYMEMSVAQSNNLHGENVTMLRNLGPNFLKAYQGTRSLDVDAVKNGEIKPPSFELLEKYVLKHADPYDIRFVEWVDNERVRHAYILKSTYEKDGLKRGEIQIVEPFVNDDHKPDLSSDYYSFFPEWGNHSAEHKSRPFYVIEQDHDNLHFVQIVRPTGDKKKRFQIVFAGVTDRNTGKCLNFTRVFPKRDFYLSGSDMVKGKDVRSYGLRLSQESMNIEANNAGERAVRINEDRKVSTYLVKILTLINYIYLFESQRLGFQPEVLELMNKNIHLNSWLTGIMGILSIIGGINIVHLLDLKSDQLGNVKLMIQAAREKGVDLMNGMPDSDIPYFSQLIRSYAKLTS